MKNRKITILNTSILTNFGEYSYTPLEVENVRQLVQHPETNVLSAVGHKATAEILTELLDISVPENRIQYSQEVGDTALVFKLNSRIPEGVILSKPQIEEIGYTFGLLTRTA